jgi:methionine sulfoxide reductase catalytic subunit
MQHYFVLAASDFPVWLRITHYINLLFLFFLIRAGLQILMAHPRLYWSDSCKPGTQWIKFTRAKVPKDQLYTSMDDEKPISPVLALPGGDNLGLGRHWHFFSAIFWILNGLVYVILLFATGEWSHLIPTSWDIFPRAWQTFLTYATFHIPPHSDFRPFDPLQQLAYAGVVFVLAPFQILTALAMSPAIEGRFPWFLKLLGGKQGARSLHFIGLVLFILFVIVHVVLVFVVHFQENVRNIVLGDAPGDSTNMTLGLAVFFAALFVVVVIMGWASWFSLRHKRITQHALGAVIDPVRDLILEPIPSVQHYKPSKISSYFWVNGRPPETEEFNQLLAGDFKDYRLEVSGLVVNPLHLSLDSIRKLPKKTQITKHNCIQGWSGIAEWGGVPMSEIVKLCGVKPEAKYAVFTSFQHGKQSYPHGPKDTLERPFYEVLDVRLMERPQTLLAYEMNGQPLPLEHGAPLRLRVEDQLGFKMVKYVRSVEFVDDYSHIWEGQGGFREDVQFYSRGAEI